MRFCIDIDDTLWDFVSPLIETLNEKYYLNFKKTDIKGWNIDNYVPLTREQIFEPVETQEFWQKVTPIKGSQAFLKQLISNGHEVMLVTAACPKSVPYKAEMLKKYFPFIDWYKHVIVASNKQVINADIRIDDGIHNLISPNGIRLLYTQPWNEDFDEKKYYITRVYDFDDMQREIRRIQEENLFS